MYKRFTIKYEGSRRKMTNYPASSLSDLDYSRALLNISFDKRKKKQRTSVHHQLLVTLVHDFFLKFSNRNTEASLPNIKKRGANEIL
jgi:hypothetical protein